MFYKSLLLSLLVVGSISTSMAQLYPKKSLEIAAGIQSYYVPLKHFKVQNAQPVFMAGANHTLNTRQNLELGIRLGYNRHKYQGDGLFIQALIRYMPVIARHFQPMIGSGIGYQLSFYPSTSLKYDGTNWVQGPKSKGVIQVPLHVGIGYRSIETKEAFITPFLAYQVNALFRYSPDLTPLPASNFLLGLRYAPRK
ncbi:MAG TPA: hypothetical protein VFV46_07115 [Lacibacter sp.]|nr:hypothetical protein [Lacibacter sp.]